MAAVQRIPMLQSEVTRLEHELSILERQWNRKHRLGFFALLAIPAYFLFGPLIAGVVLLCTPALIGMQAYLLGVRRMECRQLILETQRELEAAKHAPA